MTLRSRLVAALVILVVLAQSAFVAATYIAYSRSRYQLLDSELRSSVSVVSAYLDTAAGISTPAGLPAGPHFGPPVGDGPDGSERSGAPAGGTADITTPTAATGSANAGFWLSAPTTAVGPHSSDFAGAATQSGQPAVPSATFPPGSYAELIAPGGTVVAQGSYESGTSRPALPAEVAAAGPQTRLLTVGSTRGSTRFRVIITRSASGFTTVLATPTTQVTDSLDHLLVIEATAIAALVLVVSVGTWLVMRRGLRPLERMAATAGQISAGDFRLRVDPGDSASEVGELGSALNRMLDGIEAAFAEREATEIRLRQFLADASHELRTPLTSIQGFAELFRLNGEQARVDLPTILRRIEQESARMKVLVESLLLLARLDQNPAVDMRPTDLSVLAADACTDAVAVDHSRPVILDAPQPVEVLGDPAHLRQALSNLLSNALRHTPPGTPIEVACTRQGHLAVVSVRDHGQGLDVDALSHAFDRFWQGDKARVGAGSGLGLSIVAAIAGEHAGKAEASNAVGGGAIFTITLPALGPKLTEPLVSGSPGARR